MDGIMKGIFNALVLAFTVLGAACVADTEEKSQAADPVKGEAGTDEPQPINVALQGNGATATASYDNDHAHIVNDGFLGVKPYWAGNAQGDHVTIKFDDLYLLRNIKIFTGENVTNLLKIRVSMDGNSYTDVDLGNGTPSCDDVDVVSDGGLGTLVCSFNGGVTARFLRIVVDDPNPEKYPLREIAAWGV